MPDIEEVDNKFTLTKYIARSFLLPLFGLIAVAVLAYRVPPDQWEQLKYPGLAVCILVGVFNANEGFKTWVETTTKGGPK